MHSNQRKTMVQPDVSATDDDRTAASDGHVHDWQQLALGFEMCVGCGKIRRTPKNYATGAHPRRPIAVLVAVARRRLRRLGGRDAR